ncbi:Magnesium transporter MRS2/LPE10 [Artemisia annua]|uniref:Magnesium transporter MRS2/LPE10 n=1 Tax=Artemisia annua TaxID=35608 RepID=A0A2U1LY92_ARTAN|nr:Magnesium transporter MRS2/LPE10 [Artemisia annua]
MLNVRHMYNVNDEASENVIEGENFDKANVSDKEKGDNADVENNVAKEKTDEKRDEDREKLKHESEGNRKGKYVAGKRKMKPQAVKGKKKVDTENGDCKDKDAADVDGNSTDDDFVSPKKIKIPKVIVGKENTFTSKRFEEEVDEDAADKDGQSTDDDFVSQEKTKIPKVIGDRCGLRREYKEQKLQLVVLRKKYAAKILLSEINQKKADFEVEAEAYRMLPLEERQRLEDAAFERVKARVTRSVWDCFSASVTVKKANEMRAGVSYFHETISERRTVDVNVGSCFGHTSSRRRIRRHTEDDMFDCVRTAAQLNIGGPGLRKKAKRVRPWGLLDSTSQAQIVDVGKHAIMHRTGLPAHDLRILDPILSYPSTVLGRGTFTLFEKVPLPITRVSLS